MNTRLDIDDSTMLEGLTRLLSRAREAVSEGLHVAAPRVEGDLQATDAHGDQSGATRASYTAYVIGPNDTGSAEAANGYAAAVGALEGFTGHSGKPLSEDSGIELQEGEHGILLTSFTDYQDKLETSNAGERATLGPILTHSANEITSTVAAASRRKLS